MLSQNNIYTIHIDENSTPSITLIETVINRGLYRFTLLGMNTKQASDTKDRVYSSLRASNLLNLKSDNRKIIVNISPETTYKGENFYDLGIALSCVYNISKNPPSYKILALGGLSISGKILATHRLRKAIYTAYAEQIPVIVCSTEDVASLDTSILDTLHLFGIHIVHNETLQGLVEKLKTHQPNNTLVYTNSYVHKINPVSADSLIRISDMNTTLRAFYIGLCGGHNVIIETPATQVLHSVYKNICTYKRKGEFGQDLYTYHIKNMKDEDTYKETLYIERLRDRQYVDTIKKKGGGVIGAYPPCSCEYSYSFFEQNIREKKCICSKRNIIQYRRNIENTYFNLFDIAETHHQPSEHLSSDTIEVLHRQIDVVRALQFKRFLENMPLTEKEVYFFGKEDYLNKYCILGKTVEILTPDAYILWKTSGEDESVLRVARTIEDILLLELGEMQEKKPVISEQALLLSLSYIPRMDS